MSVARSNKGIFAAVSIIGLWSITLLSLMTTEAHLTNPLIYLMIFVQMHLYTGLFITAHDAMHGTVSQNKSVNNFIGQLCTLLYACFPFKKLYVKHHEHHEHVHTERDPDYHSGNFFVWYFKFIKEYITWWQLVLMALIYNVLKVCIPELNLVLFWVIPSVLSTLQLFYFGTWVPHHGEHNNKYHSRTQSKNHFTAFFSCYFFGYHYEHHDSPGTPWWQLWKLKHANK